MDKQKKPTPIEEVLTGYVIENANLKLQIKELEQLLREKEEEKGGE